MTAEHLMEHARTLNAVTRRLSLRAPHAASLEALARAIEAAPSMLRRERSLDAILTTTKAVPQAAVGDAVRLQDTLRFAKLA